jgi:hypothetical protein
MQFVTSVRLRRLTTGTPVTWKRRDVQTDTVTRQTHIAWIRFSVVEAIGKALLESKLTAIESLSRGRNG